MAGSWEDAADNPVPVILSLCNWRANALPAPPNGPTSPPANARRGWLVGDSQMRNWNWHDGFLASSRTTRIRFAIHVVDRRPQLLVTRFEFLQFFGLGRWCIGTVRHAHHLDSPSFLEG